MVDIISINCQGLGCYKKRKDVFNYLHNLNANIYCLQDTHFTSDIENQIISEWGYHALFSSHTSNSRGVSILFKNNFEYEIEKHIVDSNGNFIVAQILVEKKRILVINIYGPNNDKPEFYTSLFQKFEDFNYEYIIMCGDFNLVQNPHIDYFNYVHVISFPSK